MFGYYLELAARSFRRDPALTLLMMLAIAIGIGASMTSLTVYHVMAQDPYPGRSEKLYRPQLDPRRANDREAVSSDVDTQEPYPQVSWADGMHLLQAKRADRQTLMRTSGSRIEPAPGQPQAEPEHPTGMNTTADFFPMFGAPFRYGRPWNATDDDAEARLIVISDALNQRFFDGKDSTGKVLLFNDIPFQVVGVLAPWRVLPRVYGTYDPVEFTDTYDFYIPLNTAVAISSSLAGNYYCWDPKASFNRGPEMKATPCAWLAMWVELDSPAKADAYREFLTHYAQEQKNAGRFERPPNIRLRSLPEWLAFYKAVPADVRLQTWLAFGFLLVCLVNATGLLLAKFMRRFGELSVRRALGATRRDVFAQLLVEAGVIGLAGGVLGLGLAYAGLWLVRRQPSRDIDYTSLAHLDLGMLAITFVVALLASISIGLLPAWQACRVAPALQLKTQ